MLKRSLSLLLVVSMILSIFYITPIYAEDNVIDLTDFATGSAASHTHFWVDDYDDTYHWQYCSLCKIVQNKTTHTLNTSYSVGANSCSYYNYKITQCDSCLYSTKVKSQKAHTCDFLWVHVDSTNVNYAYSCCRVCRENYNFSYEGDYYTYSNGEDIDFENFQIGSTIKDLWGNTRKIDILIKQVTTMPSLFNITTNIVNNTSMIISAEITIPDEYKNTWSSQWINDNKISVCVQPYCLEKGYETGMNWHSPTNITCDVKNNKIYFDYTIQLRDYTDDFMNSGSFGVWVDFNSYINSTQYTHKRYQTGLIIVNTNFIDPTITSSTYKAGESSEGYATSLSVDVSGQIVGSFFGYVTIKDKTTGDVLYPRTEFAMPANSDIYNLNLSLDDISYAGGQAEIIIEDYFGKSVTRSIDLPAIDTVAPIITNLDSIDLVSEWDSQKSLILELEDDSSEIYVSINNENNYQKVIDNTITYILTGDVYSEKNICVYTKDGAGNVGTTLIPVNKLDVTVPVIDSVVFTESLGTQPIITITANDTSGSELKYQLKDENGNVEVPWSDSNILNVSKEGIFTVEVKDAVGNMNAEQIEVDLIEYTVTFKSENDEVISEKYDYHYGDIIEIPEAPEKEGTQEYVYTFGGWGVEEGAIVVGNAEYKASYIESVARYTIVFKNSDGSIISETVYNYGDNIVVPENPTKSSDKIGSYIFKDWDNEISFKVVSNATYIAQYDVIYNEYSVVFKDDDGSVILEKNDYHWGDTISLPENPKKDATNETVYSFSHWTPNINSIVEEDAEYIAVYSENVAQHNVVFKDWNGVVILENTYDYGEDIIIPENPSRESDDIYNYTFKGWTPNVEIKCLGGAEYIAQYDFEYIDYTIIFKDYDGSILFEKNDYHYGDTVITPSVSRPGYKLTGWGENFSATVVGDATYIAEYSKISTGGNYKPSQTYYKVMNNSDSIISNKSATVGKLITITLTKEQIKQGEIPFVKDTSGKEIEIKKVNDNTYTFKMPNKNVIISTYTDLEDKEINENRNDVNNIEIPKVITGGYYDITESDGVVTIITNPKPNYILESIKVKDSSNNIINLKKVEENVYQFNNSGKDYFVDIVYSLICLKDYSCPIYHYIDSNVRDWYHDGVHYSIENGYMIGVSNNKFSPNTPTTRGQIVQILWRLEGSPNSRNYFYTDVSQEVWYFDAISWATSIGVVKGYGNNLFGPDDFVTREQIASIFHRYVEYKSYNIVVDEVLGLSDFIDSDLISSYALSSIEFAIDNDLLNGVSLNVLDPQGLTSRAQMATILQRFCTQYLDK